MPMLRMAHEESARGFLRTDGRAGCQAPPGMGATGRAALASTLSLLALLVLASHQGLLDELVPDRIRFPNVGHGRPGLVERDPVPQHTVEHDKGRHAHIGDTVD